MNNIKSKSGITKPCLGLLPYIDIIDKFIILTVVYAFKGTFGAFLPKSEVNTKPSIEINRNDRKVTRFPHPGSDLTRSSRKITFRLHPKNTVNIASLTFRLVPCFNDSVDDFMLE